ncbi:exodeoxyribonuclease V subunit alpha [Vibrio tapetis subsp. quintayensis]|uniref:exodeoxyribonuclease V subunit alpha n=1 Tax=Vibrio tapetis TaxID=52443 RepID=UPI0025B41E6F|nr:exodeoxyribonuclease V subunit alpha [Vibrio tapetis]MDN3681402.1 exodeoxyribonuclease V subunit alpha [Vibrio tapetis subsp. quintayensis]
MFSTLQRLSQKGVLRQLDYQFGRFIANQEPTQSERVGFLAALLSHELGKGHICIDLTKLDISQMLGLYGEQAAELNLIVSDVNWLSLMQRASVIGSGSQAKPLVLDGSRLYLHRYWHYESQLSDVLKSLAQSSSLASSGLGAMTQTLDHLFTPSFSFLFKALTNLTESNQVLRQQLVCDHLDVVLPEQLDWSGIDQVLVKASKAADLEDLRLLVPTSACLNWQKVAAAVALTRRFAVISGGPGTGKTTTVAKLLAALVEQGNQANHLPIIKLIAPTGKAAARLTESIGAAISQLPVDPEIIAAIPTEASTIHRLLGAIPNRAEFRHNKVNPLHLDILVVDEASMVDLPMMHKLIDALPNQARLILLGDKDQLASVEAGAVLGDICSFIDQGFSAQQGQQLATLTGFDWLKNESTNANTGLADSLCMLQKSYRFDARSGIGQLAKAINAGKPYQVEQVWLAGFTDIKRHDLSKESYAAMIDMMVANYSGYLSFVHTKDKTTTSLPKQVLKEFSKSRLLCAIREGDFGLTGLNLRIEAALRKKRLIPSFEEQWYVGRPVMVTRNDHGLGLYNGDIGICMLDESEDEARLRVYFELPDGSVKGVLPSRVPQHETAYAMTIHKSQGSEFDHTVMVLPNDFSPILTRELIYTGITRAKSQLDLFCQPAVLSKGVSIKTIRSSGLAQRLSSL